MAIAANRERVKRHRTRAEELLEEWERVIVREHQRSPESAAAITDAIREFFDDSRIDPASYRSHVAEMPGPDADDHVHSAAAIAGGAEMLVTWDRSGFPTKDLADLGLRVTDPDAYLCEMVDGIGDQVIATLEGLAARGPDLPCRPMRSSARSNVRGCRRSPRGCEAREPDLTAARDTVDPRRLGRRSAGPP